MLISGVAIWQFLSKKACEKLVVALVTSRLDYCNSLLNGLSQTHMLRLQRVQNTAARLICHIKKFDYISTSLQSLHWLPSMHCISSFAWRWPPLPSRVDLSLPPHTLIAFWKQKPSLCSSLPHSHLRQQVVYRRNRYPLERPAAGSARRCEPLLVQKTAQNSLF